MNNEQLITRSIDWLVARFPDQPGLDEAALHAGLEATSYQKLFTRHVGLSPKKFIEIMTYRTARDLLAEGNISTLDAAYEAGLSGNGRLHDLFVKIEAATPGEVKSKGKGLIVTYGFAPSPFGELIIARTSKGICWLGFRVDDSRDRCLERIRDYWPNAAFVQDDAAIADDAVAVCAICAPVIPATLRCANARVASEGRGSGDPRVGASMTHVAADAASGLDTRLRGYDETKKISLHIHGTNFQMQVWQALLKIPSRHFLSYENLGAAIGRPGSPRAIGNAVGANPVSLLIPCHRVIQKTGILNNYGWGSARKKALLGIECA